MSFFRALSMVAVASVGFAPAAIAGSLQVSTVNIEVLAPGATAAMSLRNTGASTASAQVRIFKWMQVHGVEELIPTDEVIASPPFANLEPGSTNVIRIVRVSSAPVRDEETYRLIIDELPNANSAQKMGVKLALRYSLPVFFRRNDQNGPAITWSATLSDGMLRLTAINGGDQRMRLASLNIVTPTGDAIATKEGLVGYVLGKSQMTWSFPMQRRADLSGQVLISSRTDGGPINEIVDIK